MLKKDLGTIAEVANLFSFPNNSGNICYLPWSLEDTVKHYLTQNIKRDGYETTSIKITQDQTHIFIETEGESFTIDYLNNLVAFLEIGSLGFKLATDRNDAKKWRYNWRFLLPLGISIYNHKTIEMMDFPPETLVTQKQDYLNSKTSNRWAELLTINGAAFSDLEKYESILDIVPIAAPAGDGKILDDAGVYNGDFDSYTLKLLDFFSKTSNPKVGKPLIAFGTPIRQWLKRKYNLNLNVLTAGAFTLNDRVIPVIGSNHPAFVFYAGNKFICEADKDKLNFELACKVMQQDLIVANWQVKMGNNPMLDPVNTLHTCKANWDNRIVEIEALVNKQVYNKPPLQEAVAKLSFSGDVHQLKITDEQISAIEKNTPLEFLRRDW
jgi:hypothetical protein